MHQAHKIMTSRSPFGRISKCILIPYHYWIKVFCSGWNNAYYIALDYLKPKYASPT